MPFHIRGQALFQLALPVQRQGRGDSRRLCRHGRGRYSSNPRFFDGRWSGQRWLREGVATLRRRPRFLLPQRLGALLFSRGESFYNFQGLRRFKEKFQPNWQPRYLAVPAGIEPYLALADTTALISGGLSGLVQR